MGRAGRKSAAIWRPRRISTGSGVQRETHRRRAAEKVAQNSGRRSEQRRRIRSAGFVARKARSVHCERGTMVSCLESGSVSSGRGSFAWPAGSARRSKAARVLRHTAARLASALGVSAAGSSAARSRSAQAGAVTPRVAGGWVAGGRCPRAALQALARGALQTSARGAQGGGSRARGQRCASHRIAVGACSIRRWNDTARSSRRASAAVARKSGQRLPSAV
jgi:hypothetical protein